MTTVPKSQELITILIAEDSLVQAEKLKFLLESNNFNVVTAKNGGEAFELVQPSKPNLIISDIIMPELNGYQLCERVKSNEATRDIPVILLTSLSSTEDVLEAINCGADSFLTKPYKDEYLISYINEMLSGNNILKRDNSKKEVEIIFQGEKRIISASQQQILTLLISTYEAAVNRNNELMEAKEELSNINEHLEFLISERTSELSKEIAIRKISEYQVQKLNRTYILHSNVNKAIIRAKDELQLFNDICRISVEDGKFNMAWIGLISEEASKLEIVAWAGNEIFFSKTPYFEINNINDETDPIGQTLIKGIQHPLNNLENDNITFEQKDEYIEMGNKSLCTFPIKFYGNTIGVFTIFSNETNFFNGDEIKVLNDLLNDISFALEYQDKEAKRKEGEEQLIKSEESYRAVSETANDAIININNKGIIIGWNKAAERIFGYTKQNMIGNDLDIIIPKEYLIDKISGLKFFESGSEVQIIGRPKEIKAINQNKQEFPIEISLSEWESGTSKFYTAIIRDITDRKKTENDLIKAKNKAEESDRLKSAFLANMSHEIRTPMNGIIGFSELLKEPMLSGEEQLEYISHIEVSSNRMLNIINDIISISTLESGDIEVIEKETNVNEIIDDVFGSLKQIAEYKNLEVIISKELPNERSVIITDKSKLRVVLEKLVSNAIKFTEKGGIEIGYKLKQTSELEFWVKDTGIGIPISRQRAIYERFIQADIKDLRAHQGAGLGLTIAKSYIDLLGGEIWQKSIVGEGSCFYFTIPYKVSGTTQESKNKSNEIFKNLNNNLKVLIAEDDILSQEFLSISIEKITREILIAENGQEAIDICSSNPDIDLVLMDIKMPIMNGYEATKKIREFNKDVIIIAQTAFAMPEDIKNAFEAGCNEHIAKPVRTENLIQLLNQYGPIN
ncbi:MAG: hypothetical protein C0595_08545 [Marinilabiliales bacterium]|nr:MAG: hypothetical protein C0595_08545 [Marinilabiliales bacterium]